MDDGGEALSVALPPNMRLTGVTFDDKSQALVVTFEGDKTRTVPAPMIRALHGARIRHEAVVTTRLAQAGEALEPAGLAMSARPVRRMAATVTEELHYALAMRVDGVDELWYLLGDSFNFRKSLRELATYSGELNVRAFVKRLSTFAPQAVRDSFFTAMLAHSPLPPPLNSLVEFFRIVAR